MSHTMTFLYPTDGDCLCDLAGLPQDGSLTVKVRLAAPAARTLSLAGVPALREGEQFVGKVRLAKGENTLTATDDRGNTATITVYYFPAATGRFRISLDDNIRFLQDIAKNADTYRSIFENPYLALLRRLHLCYGCKIHANLFYSSLDGSFTLADMPDRYRAEWRENSNWLRLSFHARGEFPDKPYLQDDGSGITRDLSLVAKEILRFAGEEAYAATDTTLHWGTCTKEGSLALSRGGVRHVAGYFDLDRTGEGVVSYHLTPAQITHMREHGIWHDRESGLFCTKIDAVLNAGTKESIREALDRAATAPARGFFEVLMHEQYFYPDYKRYLADFEERFITALDWAEEKGLTPAFLSDLTC